MPSDDLECGGLVHAGVSCEDALDKRVKGCVQGFSKGSKVVTGSLGGGGVHEFLQSSRRCSDSGLWIVWVAVSIAWNVALTAGMNHSSVRASAHRREN